MSKLVRFAVLVAVAAVAVWPSFANAAPSDSGFSPDEAGPAIQLPTTQLTQPGPDQLAHVTSRETSNGRVTIASESGTSPAGPTGPGTSISPDGTPTETSPSADATPERRRSRYGCYERSAEVVSKAIFGAVTAWKNHAHVHWCGYLGGRITSVTGRCSWYANPFIGERHTSPSSCSYQLFRNRHGNRSAYGRGRLQSIQSFVFARGLSYAKDTSYLDIFFFSGGFAYARHHTETISG
jgi:hypothetical protein